MAGFPEKVDKDSTVNMNVIKTGLPEVQMISTRTLTQHQHVRNFGNGIYKHEIN